MSWNTKRDGYYSRPASNALGSPVSKLEPREGTTHVVTIPGTTYRCFLQLDESGLMTPERPKTRYYTPTQIKVDALLKSLARTTIAGTGKRRIKVSPVLLTIAEFQALNTEVKAA